jgi:FG-GAP-like repeat
MDPVVTFVPRGDVATTGFYFSDAFTGSGVLQPNWIASSSATAGQAVLTAATGAKPTGGIAGLPTAIDTPGNGALRLTNATNDQSAFVLYNQAFDSNKGVNITFDMFQYGGTAVDGNPGDGLSFFLIDGAVSSVITPGAFGGSLGYASSVTNGGASSTGLTGAYIGVGFDAFGNFSDPVDSAPGGPGQRPDSIAVRGKASENYKYLAGTETLPGGLDTPTVLTAATRGQARRTVEIDLNSAGILNVSIDLNNDGDFDDASEQPIVNFNTTANGAAPATYKFGFAASTGGATDIHEVRNLAIAPSKASDGAAPGRTTPNPITFGEFGTGLTYVENATPGKIAQALTIEGTVASITSATVELKNGFASTQDRLTIGGVPATATGTITGTTINWAYDATGGKLTLTGAGTTAQYQDALRQVAYANTSDAPTTGDRTVRYSLLNGTTLITLRDALVKINAIDDLPTDITLSSTGVPVGVAGGVVGTFTVVDADGTGDAGSYTFTQPTDARFEIVGTAATGFQLKLKAGQTLAAGSPAITGLAIGLVDAGAPNGGAFSKNFDLTPGQRKSEIFWRNPNGTEVFWQVDGTKLVGGALINSPYNTPAWSLKGVADMDGDGIKDHIYQNVATRELGYLLFTETNGQTTGNKPPVAPTFNSFLGAAATGQPATPGVGWDLVGVENVSGTAQADLIFYSRSLDRIVYWETNATNQVVGAGFFTSTASPGGQGTGAPNSWNVEAVADFTGDGKVDLLWRNAQGIVVLWKVNGTVIDLAASQVLPTVAPGFSLRGIGDFNGDNIKDVVWRNQTTNVTRFWSFNTSGIATQTADNAAIVGAGFQIEAIADFNGDGKSDIVWRDTVSDRSVVWNFNLGTAPTPTLQISTVLAGTDFIRNFLPGVTANVPYINGDRAWDIDAANGIPAAAAVV